MTDQMKIVLTLALILVSVTDVLSQIPLDPSCNTSKGCFYNCTGSSCTFLVTWMDAGDSVTYTLTSTNNETNFWTAIGFSDDRMMGNDSVTGCTYSSGNVSIFNAKNKIHQQPDKLQNEGIALKNSSFKDGIFTCTFDRLKAAGTSIERFDLYQPWYILFAKGALIDSKLSYHEQNKMASDTKFTASSQTPEPDPSAASLPTPSTGTVSKVSGCGTAIGCFSDCQGTTCSFIISWYKNGSDAVYTLTAGVAKNPEAWIAMGFSSDNQMGNDDVMGCVSNGSGHVVAFSAWNKVHAAPDLYDDPEINITEHKNEDGLLSCTFVRPIAAGTTHRHVNISRAWTLLFAKGRGSISEEGKPSIYFHGQDFYISQKQLSVDDLIDLGSQKTEYPLVKAHGSLMIAAWIFLASIGIVVARYYKPVWKRMVFSEKAWFQVHRACMVLVFCATAAGFIIIFIEVDGYSNIAESRYFLVGHPIIGIIVMILTVLNPLMAIFRPHPESSKRPIFNWAHFFVGTSAHILAVVNIFFGVLLAKANVPYYLVYILAAYTAWQIFVELLLEVLSYLGQKIDRSEVYELCDNNTKQDDAVESSPTILVKRMLLVIHCAIVALFAVVLIILLALGNDKLMMD